MRPSAAVSEGDDLARVGRRDPSGTCVQVILTAARQTAAQSEWFPADWPQEAASRARVSAREPWQAPAVLARSFQALRAVSAHLPAAAALQVSAVEAA